MAYNNFTYVILDKSEIVGGDGRALIDFSQLLNRDEAMLRYSLDDSKGLVKYDGEQPSFLNSKTTYTHQEILTEMAKSDWTEEEE